MADHIKEVIIICLMHQMFKADGHWFKLTDGMADKIIDIHNTNPNVWIDMSKEGCNCGGGRYGS